jgi:hypothetical protein
MWFMRKLTVLVISIAVAFPALASPEVDCSSLKRWSTGPTSAGKIVWAPSSGHYGAEYKSKKSGYSNKAPKDDPDWWDNIGECKPATNPKS